MSRTVKVAVTGAAGQIGYALLPRLASGEVFGPDIKVSLHLLEIPPALPALEGVVMELEDCAFPLLDNVVPTADAEEAFSDVNWALLVGSKPRGPGMKRGDLIRENGPIFVGQGQALAKKAANNVRILVVGNPANTNCLIAMNNAQGIPNERFSAMTRLDQNRAYSRFAQEAGVPISAVSNVTIWGNHSATQYPDIENAKINGQPALDVFTNLDWLQGEFIEFIQQRGASIIQARGGLSSAASAANAITDHVKSMESVTPEGDWFSAGVPADGSYGIDKGLIFSFPLRSDSQGNYEIVQGLEFSEFAKAKIQATLEELREEKAVIADLLS